MPGPRWNKVLRDLWGNKLRSLLVVLSIAVGVLAVGTIAHMSVIVSRNLLAPYHGPWKRATGRFAADCNAEWQGTACAGCGIGL